MPIYALDIGLNTVEYTVNGASRDYLDLQSYIMTYLMNVLCVPECYLRDDSEFNDIEPCSDIFDEYDNVIHN